VQSTLQIISSFSKEKNTEEMVIHFTTLMKEARLQVLFQERVLDGFQ
jgi:hypothetical protein